MQHGSRTKLITAVVLALVFGSGMLVGYAMDGSGGAEAAVAPTEGSKSTAAARPTHRVPVYEQLHPTPEQTERIDSILRDHRDQMVEIHDELRTARETYQTKYDAVIQDTREAIAGVFPPEEAVRYRKLLAEFDRAREQETSSRGGRTGK
jgi:hypothetical protein